MTYCGPEYRHRDRDRDRAGSAAEDFARRIARDAQRFGERVAEHASEFARDVAREWRHGPGFDPKPIADDVRGVLREVRTLVAEVIEGADELLEKLFARPESPNAWVRVVTSREVDCTGCGRRIGAGEDCLLRRTPAGREFRCAECGPPKAEPSPGA
jgi:hypothetical protein